MGGTMVGNGISVQVQDWWFANVCVEVDLRDRVKYPGLKVEDCRSAGVGSTSVPRNPPLEFILARGRRFDHPEEGSAVLHFLRGPGLLESVGSK